MFETEATKAPPKTEPLPSRNEPLPPETKHRGLFSWSQALDLSERRALTPSAAKPQDEALAAQRLDRWRRQSPFAEHPDLWRQRLAMLDASNEEHRALLSESPTALRRRAGSQAPAWAREIERAYARPSEPFPWPRSFDLERAAFMPLIEPLIHRAFERLKAEARDFLERFPKAPFAAGQAALALASSLPVVFAPYLSRAMVVELHVAKLEEQLTGETSEERFADFQNRLRRPEFALEILQRYPVLARQLVERIDLWREASAELLKRLAADSEEIERRFAPRGLGLLSEVRGAAGDPHRGGRTVHILTFDSGARVVYKPRPMAVEQAFQRFLAWINDQQVEAPFKQLEIWDQGAYGWVEYVEPKPCQETAEVARFYHRMGSYLAILFLLDGTDFHHENLIAMGEHPVLIDLETLFQPWVIGESLTGQDEVAGSPLSATVLRSNLLPEHWWGSEEEAGVDLSGMGSKTGQLTPRPVVATTARGTDEMRVERRRVEIPQGENRPHLGDEEVSLLDHQEDLVRGWEEMFDLFLSERDNLLAASGPLSVFKGAEIRILFRTTAAYGALLYESFHPHLVGNALDRQRHFDRLWSDVALRPWLASLITVELSDLDRGDVPLFSTRAESVDVWTSSGERLPKFLDMSGLERVRQRLRQLESERHRQTAIISDSYAILRVQGEKGSRPSFEFEAAEHEARREELLAAAIKAGERVLERAFYNSREAHWLEITYREPNGWQLVPTGPDVYLGNPGIALALAYLGRVTERDDFTSVARRAVQTTIHQIEASPNFLDGIGAFSGWGGVIYTLNHLGLLWQEDALLAKALDYTRGLAERAAEDEMLDVVAGSAGCILSLLSLHEVSSEGTRSHLLDIMRACGDRLVAKAEPQEHGVGWVMPLAGSIPLAGFSHGAAGNALALLRLATLTGEERYRETALQGIAYERGLFQSQHQNWPDLRAGAEIVGLDGSDGHQIWAWCHGAPGIGLARLLGLPWLDDSQVREEIDQAVASTLKHGFGKNHSLCHGDLGNLDFLLDAARVQGDEDALATVYRYAGGLLRSLEREGWLFGLPGNLETPSLMVGLAGIAYGLARLAEPDQLPSILALAPPLQAS